MGEELFSQPFVCARWLTGFCRLRLALCRRTLLMWLLVCLTRGGWQLLIRDVPRDVCVVSCIAAKWTRRNLLNFAFVSRALSNNLHGDSGGISGFRRELRSFGLRRGAARCDNEMLCRRLPCKGCLYGGLLRVRSWACPSSVDGKHELLQQHLDLRKFIFEVPHSRYDVRNAPVSVCNAIALRLGFRSRELARGSGTLGRQGCQPVCELRELG